MTQVPTTCDSKPLSGGNYSPLAGQGARGEAPADALHLRVATVAVVLLRNEFIVHGYPAVPDDVLVEIVDEVYLPLIRGRRGVTSGAG